MNSTLDPLVDADGLVYRTGFAAATGEPLEYTLHTSKKTLEEILRNFDNQKTTPTLVLSGKTNFRDTYCKILPLIGPPSKGGGPWQYKGNRLGAPKPEHYNEIREYFIKQWGAIVTEGIEADDYIASKSYVEKGKCCIVSQDKDFKTIRGAHFNWVKKKFFNVTDTRADLFLLYQALTGDRTDHIPGLKGVGEKGAANIIKDNNYDIGRIKKVIGQLYLKQFGKQWREVLDENLTLLFLQREPGKTYKDYIGSW